MVETRELQFYTTGEAYMGILEDMFRSGLFYNFEQLLSENFTSEQVKLAFKHRIKLSGDTREGDLICEFLENDPPNLSEILYWSIRTSFMGTLNERFIELVQMSNYNEEEEKRVLPKHRKGHKHLKTLLNYFTKDEIFTICCNEILKEEGYAFSEMPEEDNERNLNGVILKDGRFIECGYQDHINLFPVLSALGLSDSSDWTDSKEVIHISSGQINGTAANKLSDNWRRDKKAVPLAQVETLWRLRNYISGLYASYGEDNTCIPNLVRTYVIDNEDLGGKWGNLTFLKTYYPHIKTPKISTVLEDFQGAKQIFMRTSPLKSLPGLLNSRLIEPTEHDFNKAKNFMEYEFDKFKTVIHKNVLHWFFQEFLEGSNGVCHIKFDTNAADSRYEFNYQLSPNQGDVVKGKITDEKLFYAQENKLKSIAIELFEDIQSSLQLEFVVHDNDIYIVQLRILENEFERGLGDRELPNAIITGKTFSRGNIDVNIDDILIVSEDAGSEELIGKKALIVENSVEFSHILALSKALKIPSMFGTGKINIPKGTELIFSATTKTSSIAIKQQ